LQTEQQVSTNSSRIDLFMQTMEKQIKSIADLDFQVKKLHSTKVETEVYSKTQEKTREELRTLDYGLDDLNNNQTATDNYLEKYQPIEMLNMMIEGLATIMDRKKIERLEEYKKAKHKMLVEKVTRDNGKPQGFREYLEKSQTMNEGVRVESLD
jgi:hypothetical protein